jgi:two-component system phosphate regulon sensor histidine kinase PhoR
MLSLEKWQLGQVRLLLELVRSYELDELIEQTRDRQQPQQREWVFHPACADAAAMVELRLLTLRGSSLPLPEGQVAVFLENLQPLVDMTEARDRAFSDLAHELRTPLTSIRLVVENLQPRLEPPLNRWVDRLLPEVDRLIDLVQNWLELTQLEIDPNKKLNRHPVEVRSLIQSVWQTLEPLARRRQLNFAYLGQENVWIRADESRIYQVFLNLLDNSIKYSCVEGHIHVEVKILPSEDAAKTVQINIIDSGSGFPDKDLPYVFERFYRGDQARARPSAVESKSKATFGSGLGLAIVRQIVLAHGGSVKAMNHPDSGGAWIIVELPEVMADSNS